MAVNDTIFSLSSGAGLAGISVIRISGPKAENSIVEMCAKAVPAASAVLRKIFHPQSKELLDQGLVIWKPGPGTFTGESIVEFQIHGGIASVRSVLDGLSQLADFRQAEAGEFSRRAFVNGRLDLVEIEGLSDLIHAQTEAQRKQALNQTDGKASKEFGQWREILIQALAYIEASIDFVEEEDVSEDILKNLQNDLILLRNNMKKRLSEGLKGATIRDGVKVVLVGEPNVGKSSILNYLAKREVAIVSDIPGTTRDVLEVSLDLKGVPVFISDTAGLRKFTDDEIEKTGMLRTRQKSKEADLVIWVGEAGKAPDLRLLEVDTQLITVWNKIDIVETVPYEGLAVSAKTGTGMDNLIELLTRFVEENFSSREPALLIRDRQISSVKACVAAIDDALKTDVVDLELMAESLRQAADQLSRLVGRVDVEDLLDVIFRDFCVGK